MLIPGIREYCKTMALEAAIDRAVNECIDENILGEFLQKNKAEINNGTGVIY